MSRRFPIAFVAIVFIFLTTIHHRRGNIPNPFTFITRYNIHSPTWYEIALKHGTDKVTSHHYERIYEHRLSPLRSRPIKMLEIGLGCDMDYGPGASYYTWLEYFTHPNFELYYIEYDAACARKWSHIPGATVYSGDQADVEFLRNFVKEVGRDFDVIIDDGGHTSHQQRVSLSVLWDAVKPGGIYFIEDLSTSYQRKYGGGIDKDEAPMKGTFMEDLKSMLDDINRWGMLPDVNPVSKGLRGLEMTEEVVALSKMRGDENLCGKEWDPC